jgi:hypothetical protein
LTHSASSWWSTSIASESVVVSVNEARSKWEEAGKRGRIARDFTIRSSLKNLDRFGDRGRTRRRDQLTLQINGCGRQSGWGANATCFKGDEVMLAIAS